MGKKHQTRRSHRDKLKRCINAHILVHFIQISSSYSFGDEGLTPLINFRFFGWHYLLPTQSPHPVLLLDPSVLSSVFSYLRPRHYSRLTPLPRLTGAFRPHARCPSFRTGTARRFVPITHIDNLVAQGTAPTSLVAPAPSSQSDVGLATRRRFRALDSKKIRV